MMSAVSSLINEWLTVEDLLLSGYSGRMWK